MTDCGMSSQYEKNRCVVVATRTFVTPVMGSLRWWQWDWVEFALVDPLRKMVPLISHKNQRDYS
jgi:hypothetical protein